MKVGFL
jgi:hypothetical protein